MIDLAYTSNESKFYGQCFWEVLTSSNKSMTLNLTAKVYNKGRIALAYIMVNILLLINEYIEIKLNQIKQSNFSLSEAHAYMRDSTVKVVNKKKYNTKLKI